MSATTPPPRTAPDIVFVHGLKGAHLANQSGRRVYLTAAQCLGLKTPKLALTPQFDSETGRQLDDGLRPTEPTGNIGYGGVLAKLYTPFLDWAEAYCARNGARLHKFVWDWRREAWEANEALERFLEQVVSDAGGSAPQLVAHSAGAHVSFPILNRRPELVHSVLYGGAAFGAGVLMLQDLSIRGGRNKLGLNPWMFTPAVWFACPFVFSWMATDGSHLTANGNPHLCEEDKTTAIDRDFCNVETYAELEVGPYAPGSGVAMTAENKAYMQKVLDNTRAYRRSIVFDPEVTYPPIECLVSDAFPTVEGYHRRPGGKGWVFLASEGARVQPGDGSVLAKAAVPPEGVPHNVTINKFGHVDILSDIANVEALLLKMQREVSARRVVPTSPLQPPQAKVIGLSSA